MRRNLPKGARPTTPSRTGRGQRGIVLVELALVLPIALLMVMATAELGRALVQYNALNKAVRDGARYLASTAILGSTGVVQLDTNTRNATRNLIVYGNTAGTGTPRLQGLTTSQVTLAVADAESASITIAYPYAPIFVRIPTPGDGADLAPRFTLQAGMVARAL